MTPHDTSRDRQLFRDPIPDHPNYFLVGSIHFMKGRGYHITVQPQKEEDGIVSIMFPSAVRERIYDAPRFNRTKLNTIMIEPNRIADLKARAMLTFREF